jgi:predicted ArsR family transcriptional regulator
MKDESKAALIKQQTRGSILRYIYGREEVSKQQIARELSLSMPTALRHSLK